MLFEPYDCLYIIDKIFYRRKLYAAKMEKGNSMINHVNYLKAENDLASGVLSSSLQCD